MVGLLLAGWRPIASAISPGSVDPLLAGALLLLLAAAVLQVRDALPALPHAAARQDLEDAARQVRRLRRRLPPPAVGERMMLCRLRLAYRDRRKITNNIARSLAATRRGRDAGPRGGGFQHDDAVLALQDRPDLCPGDGASGLARRGAGVPDAERHDRRAAGGGQRHGFHRAHLCGGACQGAGQAGRGGEPARCRAHAGAAERGPRRARTGIPSLWPPRRRCWQSTRRSTRRSTTMPRRTSCRSRCTPSRRSC